MCVSHFLKICKQERFTFSHLYGFEGRCMDRIFFFHNLDTVKVASVYTERLNVFFYLHIKVSTQQQNISKMMDSWTSQKGFPLVTVSRKGDQVILTQEPFLLTSDNTVHSSRWVSVLHTWTWQTQHNPDCAVTLFSLWNIPVTYVNDSCSLAPDCRQVFTLESKTGKIYKTPTFPRKCRC